LPYEKPRSIYNALPGLLGQIALISVALLFLWHGFPKAFPQRAHDVLGALPLALTASAYIVFQALRRPSAAELVKAILLAAAFLLWAANQFWPDATPATLFNDLAIGLFVLDVFLVVVGWPAISGTEHRNLNGN
jgi:hypothetical protein